MTIIYQVVKDGPVKATFVFLEDAQEYVKKEEPLGRVLPLPVEITKGRKKETK